MRAINKLAANVVLAGAIVAFALTAPAKAQTAAPPFSLTGIGDAWAYQTATGDWQHFVNTEATGFETFAGIANTNSLDFTAVALGTGTLVNGHLSADAVVSDVIYAFNGVVNFVSDDENHNFNFTGLGFNGGGITGINDQNLIYVAILPETGGWQDLSSYFTVNSFSGRLDFWVASDVETSPTPLPAALPLFVSGLGAMGLLGWRRKRKNAAIAA